MGQETIKETIEKVLLEHNKLRAIAVPADYMSLLVTLADQHIQQAGNFQVASARTIDDALKIMGHTKKTRPTDIIADGNSTPEKSTYQIVLHWYDGESTQPLSNLLKYAPQSVQLIMVATPIRYTQPSKKLTPANLELADLVTKNIIPSIQGQGFGLAHYERIKDTCKIYFLNRKQPAEKFSGQPSTSYRATKKERKNPEHRKQPVMHDYRGRNKHS